MVKILNRQFNDYDNIFNTPNIYHYLVHYIGDVEAEIANYPNLKITVITDKYAILSTFEPLEDILTSPPFETIIYINPYTIYSLQQISPLEASQAEFLQLNLPLNILGTGVKVAIIDTGIDYLNEEFMDEDGNTRIDYIWDQSAPNQLDQTEDFPIFFGTIYNREQIQEAINTYRQGGDPYSIVPVRDEIGHGTNMAGLIGARGKNPELRGVVPDCRFIIIKLVEDIAFKSLYKVDIQEPIYNVVSIFAALRNISNYALSVQDPIVAYLPLGSSLGSHKGSTLLERYISSLALYNGFAMVTVTGNERNTKRHASATLRPEEPIKTFDLDVAPGQGSLIVDVWVDLPNVVSVDIVSPSGDNTGVINYTTNSYTHNFVFENTRVDIFYFIPDDSTGEQNIRIVFLNLQPGIWRLRFLGNQIIDGAINAWLPQGGLTLPGTQFNPADPYGTITSPGNSDFIITAAAYNQNNNNLVDYSGNAFISGYINPIDVAAGGENALTTAPNNEIAVVSGTCVAGAIVAGACAMLFDWGIIQGNNKNLYTQTLKTYLARGVNERSGDIYPNPQWGFGMLNIFKLFDNIT
ncbi:S8 family peptidase [Caproiciproducens sp. MSJ-32]|nr:S8 family peptidase [Caproiciproducens sp. MSJ-32]MBU5454265.1 S8 family peptidase [Caproiciproducens sp. MSJ-32]